MRERSEVLREIVDVKLSTYPDKPSTSYRVGKYRTTGLFSSFEPREEQVKRVAPHYDLFLLTGFRGNLMRLIKKVNPSAKALLYMSSSLTSVATMIDAGSVDEENTEWILKNQPDWLLKDSDGRPIQGTSWSPKYWPDPANKQWQAFFVRKVNKALRESGGLWDGVLLDEFLTTRTSHSASYAGSAGTQAKYTSDGAFQRAQLEFLRNVAPGLHVPIIPNVESLVLNPTSEAFKPDFFTEVQRIAGGAEAEIFGLHAPNRHGFLEKEMLKVYLDRANKTPSGKIMLLNSPTAGLEGNIERTLYVYFSYLLVAGPERQIYWTFKEGDSSIPHFWFKEFDLDLGPPHGTMQTAGPLWKRDFANAAVLVNPNREAAAFTSKEAYFDVLGEPVRGPISLGPNSGVLLIKNRRIIPAGESKN
ncbi:MAG: hypothetical protein HY695_10485 [Deltaproteobacteria bacterium]|nr:hypothetical protein [Deltaproteobacteria bacterium]